MQRLEGVIDRSRVPTADHLKKYSLFFDKLYLIKLRGLQQFYDMLHKPRLKGLKRTKVELRYLEDRDFVAPIDEAAYFELIRRLVSPAPSDRYMRLVQLPTKVADGVIREKLHGRRYATSPYDRGKAADVGENLSDVYIRLFSAALAKEKSDFDIAPICCRAPEKGVENEVNRKEVVLKVALNQFPTPGPMSAWHDILEFKQEMQDKQWEFRRFMNSLATKKQTEGEIRDDIEWTLNEYRKAMEIHHLKVGNSLVEVFIIPIMEFAEDLVKVNWSKIAKGVLGVSKRQVELMETEMKAPGRECAYVFEAQKRFGTSAH
jgi:hypothetical protein